MSAAVALAQTAAFTGAITDPDGGRVKDAVVQAKNAANGAVVRTTSSAKGEHSLNLLAGSYEIAVPMPCCQYGSSFRNRHRRESGRVAPTRRPPALGPNRGAIGDDPILLLNAFRDRVAVPTGPAPRAENGKPDLTGVWINVYNPDTPAPPLKVWPQKFSVRGGRTTQRIIPAPVVCRLTPRPSPGPSPTNSSRRLRSSSFCMNPTLPACAKSF